MKESLLKHTLTLIGISYTDFYEFLIRNNIRHTYKDGEHYYMNVDVAEFFRQNLTIKTKTK